MGYSTALLIASGSPYHKQQYQQHTQTTKIPWENQDRVIRVKIIPVTMPPTQPRLSQKGRSCNATPSAAPTPAPIATDRPSLFFRSAMVSVPRVYNIEFRDLIVGSASYSPFGGD